MITYYIRYCVEGGMHKLARTLHSFLPSIYLGGLLACHDIVHMV